ncbi:hypothetical protein DV495_000943 [Geotrichum candidum]|nr:hypothetical protein DV454_001567 [Geotrichum candidum]KAF5135313.1 hypothetical protein DV495_000943 [Geotrichum candidum]
MAINTRNLTSPDSPPNPQQPVHTTAAPSEDNVPEAPGFYFQPPRNEEVYPPPRNPFLTDSTSDEASLGSDQHLFVSENNNNNNNNIYSTSGSESTHGGGYPERSAYLPQETAPAAIDYPSGNYTSSYTPAGGLPTPMGMSTAAAVAGSAAAVAGASAQLLPNPSSRRSSASLNMLSAEFDRYPNRISSAAPSIMSMGAGHSLLRSGNSDLYLNKHNRDSSISNDSGVSSVSANGGGRPAGKFAFQSDFSPFGGYPTSSFPLHIDEKEADDYLHNPDPILDAKYDRKCQRLDKRGWLSLLAMLALLLGAIVLFIVYPVLTYTGHTSEHSRPTTSVEQYEVLTTYEYNILSAIRTTLVDPDTPQDAKSFTALDGSKWTLAFSEEFNKEGRTFYEGDDQFWTAPDIHYAATTDLEWYDPDASTTANGTLVLTMDAFKNHNLFYRSGMLQSWNKLCFTQGYLKVGAQLAGYGHVLGLWPGIWTLGNIGRPGYLGTTEGVWPYCYSECDAGITPNQSSTDGISYLKGQKLNACTCDGEDHPNPGVGRGAPEIDALEGTVSSDLKVGVVSQSLQLAPYDIWYMPDMNFIEIYNRTTTVTNTWFGGPLQQAISMASTLNTSWYEYSDTPGYQSYGFEYLNNDNTGYIRWFIGDTPTHALYAPSLGPNGNVGQRQISKEPMSIILNLGLSNSWVYIDWPSLVWPSHMRIDYVRIYQPPKAISITCDPSGYPTYDYIESHRDVYDNPNITSWEDTEYDWPKNKLTGC